VSRLDLGRVGTPLSERRLSYADRDVMLYALSVGAGAEEPSLVCEVDGLVPLPTFATVLMARAVEPALAALGVGLAQAVHLAQSLALRAPLPVEASVTASIALRAVHDRDGAALVELESALRGSAGELLAEGASTILCRGVDAAGAPPAPPPDEVAVPGGPPAFEVEQPTDAEQALLFRLNGDRNPIHAVPASAAAQGWSRPILHGLFTFGALGLALVRHACAGAAARLRGLSGRFGAAGFPGDGLVHQGWRVRPGAWVGAVRAADSGRPLFSHARAQIAEPGSDFQGGTAR
jgi:acyl dehydratase